eukprot:15843-Heterococcus_DN1.PRE.1
MTSAYFGAFGGRYIPETLVEAHRELEEAYAAAQADPAFQAEIQSRTCCVRDWWCCAAMQYLAIAALRWQSVLALTSVELRNNSIQRARPTCDKYQALLCVDWYRKEYIGGPKVMHHAKRLSEKLGGAQISLNREE